MDRAEPLTEQRVREIVREELAAVAERDRQEWLNGHGFGEQTGGWPVIDAQPPT